MLSGERDCEANSFAVEASLPKGNCCGVGMPRSARNDTNGLGLTVGTKPTLKPFT